MSVERVVLAIGVSAKLAIAASALPARAQLTHEGVEPHVYGASSRAEAIHTKSASAATARAPHAGEPAHPAEADPLRIEVEPVVEQPERFYGRTVKVRGTIEEVLDDKTFTLDENSFSATTDLLVLLPRPVAGVRPGRHVAVTGTVTRFVRAEFEREQAWFDSDSEQLLAYENRPAVVVRVVQGESSPPAGPSPEPAPAAAAPASEPIPIEVTAGALARKPRRYYGRAIMLRGRIEDVFGKNLFTIDEDPMTPGPDVLVLNPDPAISLRDGAEVVVSGRVRRFDWPELSQSYALQAPAELIEAFEHRPVIVSEAVVVDSADQPPPSTSPPEQ